MLSSLTKDTQWDILVLHFTEQIPMNYFQCSKKSRGRYSSPSQSHSICPWWAARSSQSFKREIYGRAWCIQGHKTWSSQQKFRAAWPSSGQAGHAWYREENYVISCWRKAHTKEDSQLWRTHGYLSGRPWEPALNPFHKACVLLWWWNPYSFTQWTKKYERHGSVDAQSLQAGSQVYLNPLLNLLVVLAKESL